MLDLQNVEDKRLIDIKRIKDIGLPIYIYGNFKKNRGGRMVEEYLRCHGVEQDIKYVLDSEYIGNNPDVMDIDKYADSYNEDSILVIAIFNYEVVQKKWSLYSDRIKYIFCFWIQCLPGKIIDWGKETFYNKLSDYKKTYKMLADEKSKETMEKYLRACIGGEFDELYNSCYEKEAYFNELTANCNVDVLIDCGAFDGDSIHDFVRRFHSYDAIVAFEPDKANRLSLERRIEKEQIRDIRVIPKGVYSVETRLSFSESGDSASCLNDCGENYVDVTCLDSIVMDGKENILIKMDIEGSELEALHGAQRTIVEKRPVLAICVYHKETDLIDIPQYIDSLVGKNTYDYYLRFHGLQLAELVFYAIPKK